MRSGKMCTSPVRAIVANHREKANECERSFGSFAFNEVEHPAFKPIICELMSSRAGLKSMPRHIRHKCVCHALSAAKAGLHNIHRMRLIKRAPVKARQWRASSNYSDDASMRSKTLNVQSSS